MQVIELDKWMWPLHCPFCGKQEPGHAYGNGSGCVHLLYVIDAIGGETCYQSRRYVGRDLSCFPDSVVFSMSVTGYGGATEVAFAPRDDEHGHPDEGAQCPWEDNELLKETTES